MMVSLLNCVNQKRKRKGKGKRSENVPSSKKIEKDQESNREVQEKKEVQELIMASPLTSRLCSFENHKKIQIALVEHPLKKVHPFKQMGEETKNAI